MSASHQLSVGIIGAGPAGLMAAEVLAAAGVHVDVYERMPSVGRKLLMAGKGGLNITHTEPHDAFHARYREARAALEPMLNRFDAEALRAWAHGLGIATFVGSSGRVFPHEMKAAPLLRAWLHRLRESGVKIHVRHRWRGWNEDGLIAFDTPHGERAYPHDALVLALGGGSWPQLGSDGAWVELLAQRGVAVEALRPANSGFDVEWSEHFRTRFSGSPVKSLVASFREASGVVHRRHGELVVTEAGVEGGVVYALSGGLRQALEQTGAATLELDLAPGWEVSRLVGELSRPRGSRSLSSHVQSRTGLKGVKMGLLREVLSAEDVARPERLAAAIKALPLALARPRPLDEAISTAGGVRFDALDERLMLRAAPGIFCAGEMLDWEAPTGGYLLTACFATGRAAGTGVLDWLSGRSPAAAPQPAST
ncbi:MAG: hypothetical protein JWO70_1932 [Betaproteobacteria bacterium]|nr:hypothetical protein [Betaproteobacteria bacterium]